MMFQGHLEELTPLGPLDILVGGDLWDLQHLPKRQRAVLECHGLRRV